MKKKLFLITVFVLTALVLVGAVVLLTKKGGEKIENMPPVQESIKEEEFIDTSNLPDPEFDRLTMLINLNKPWDIVFLPDNTILFTEKAGNINLFINNIKLTIEKPSDVYNRGEGGMMGMAVDPDFNSNRYVYTCFNSTKVTPPDVRVVRWKLSDDKRTLSERKDIITGMPSKISGRHSGCQLDFGADGNLWVGTGDAANPTNPQDPKSLGGKVLRVDRDGKGVIGNQTTPFDSKIYSYGHRNVQGLIMLSKVNNKGWYGFNVEHGPTKDDEVNPLVSGNFGWDPILEGNKIIYNETVEMTDVNKFPNAIPAVWSSGSKTIATSGGTQIKGEQWKGWNGALAIGVQKGSMVKILKLDKDSKVIGEKEILTDVGRIRTIQQDKEGNLYVLTDNAGDQDVIYKLVAKE